MSTSPNIPAPTPSGLIEVARSALRRYRRQDGRGVDEKYVVRFVETLRLIGSINPRPESVCDVATFGGLEPAMVECFGIRSIDTTGSPGCPGGDVLVFQDIEGSGELRFPHHRFDLEEPFPLADESYDLVIFTEVLEHLTRDPMHTMSEINRITCLGGRLLLTTPNCISLRSMLSILRGRHPFIWAPYSTRHDRDRHNREYTPQEIAGLLEAAGYEIEKLDTRTVYSLPISLPQRMLRGMMGAALQLIRRLSGGVKTNCNGEITFSLARKKGPVRDRHPGFLYY